MFIFRQRNLNYYVTISRNHSYLKKRFIIYTQASSFMVMIPERGRGIANVALKVEVRKAKNLV